MRSLALSVALLATTAFSTASAQDVTVRTDDLGGGIFALSTDRAGNVGAVIGEDGVFIIDTQMPDLAPLIDAEIDKLSDGDDVDLVLNTHLHGDHILGNQYFVEQGAVVIAHPNVRPGILARNKSALTGSSLPELPASMLPTVNVNEGGSVTMNGQTAKFYHTPNAHTDGDIFVVFEGANIMHSGDLLFHQRFPFIDLDNGGTVDGFIAGMQRMADMADDETVIISGHGPLGKKQDLLDSIAMLKETKAEVQKLVDKGYDLEKVQSKAPLKAYHDHWNWGFITTERMVWTLYRDITGKTE